MVIAGSHKGKKGKIIEVFPRVNRVVVEGVAVVNVRRKSRVRGKAHEIVARPMPIHASNVMVIDPTTGKPTRIGKKLVGREYVRFTKKSGAELK